MVVRNSFKDPDVVRNFVFGVEDSLVSTVALVSGIAVAGVSVSNIIITGTILILVEAFSMAAGSLLSDNSADEFERHRKLDLSHSILGAIIMFVSYVVSGFFILMPYVFLEARDAFILSIIISSVFLFCLGLISAKLSGTSPVRKALLMTIIGGLAILIGVIVGNIVNNVV